MSEQAVAEKREVKVGEWYWVVEFGRDVGIGRVIAKRGIEQHGFVVRSLYSYSSGCLPAFTPCEANFDHDGVFLFDRKVDKYLDLKRMVSPDEVKAFQQRAIDFWKEWIGDFWEMEGESIPTSQPE